jgi:hypothetical protein
MSRAKVVLGFALAPLAVPIGIFVLFSVLHALGLGWFQGADYRLVLESVVIWAVYGVPIALAVTLLGGIPCYMRLNRRGRTALLPYLCRGLLLGAAPFLLFDLYIVGVELWRSALHGIRHEFFGLVPTLTRLFGDVPVASVWAGIGSYCGGLGALLFWLVSVRGPVVGRGAT